MPPKPQLIDMLRTVPEVAVRLWAGGEMLVREDGISIKFEGRELVVPKAAYDEGLKVARVLAIRWGGRMLRGIQDVLELRHAAEDVYLENMFRKHDVPSVLFVPAGVTASGYYRAMIPAELLGENPRVLANWTSKVDPAKVLRYDVLWIQLLTSGLLNEIVRQVKAEGVRIVYDIDDRLDALPEENQAIAVYGTPEKQAEIAEMMALADVVSVSTEPLRSHILAKYPGKDVRVLGNRMTANVAPRKHPSDPRFVRILWAGSATHRRDLAIVAPAIREILLEAKGKVRFTIFGGELVPDALVDCQDWIDTKKAVDFEEYHDELARIGADFGIVPLEANEFNTGKSGIKGLEYASAGYPMLCSPVAEYPALVAAGFPVELVEPDQWLPALRRMIALSREERAKLGKAGLEWVLANRCIASDHANAWADVVVDLARARRGAPEAVMHGEAVHG